MVVIGASACSPTTPNTPGIPQVTSVSPTPARQTSPIPSTTPYAPTGRLASQALGETETILDRLRTREGGSDPRYYRAKVWRDGTPECFRCTVGPAVLSAAYAASTEDPSALKTAVESLNQAIALHQRKDGSFGPAAPGEDGLAIQTVFFANSLAASYLMLEPQLSAKQKASWEASLTRSADFLIGDGVVHFYVNGNINLAVAMNMDLTYRIAGQDRFLTAADDALAFTISPPQDRWPGFGLSYTREPTKADGSDGAGFLAESGGSTPGYDPAYTANQADIAALWYLLTDHPTAERLTNLLFNELIPRVRRSDWTLDVSGGTRRAKAGLRFGFYGPALPVLALKGHRLDLQLDVESFTLAALREFAGATTYRHAGLSNSFGAQLAPTVLVLRRTPGW